MAKKTKKDQHKSGFMVRLPESYRVKLEELKAKTDRPFTLSVQRAVDDFLRKHEIEPPPRP